MTPGGTSGVPTAPSRIASKPRSSSSDRVGQHLAVAQVAGAAEVVVDRCRASTPAARTTFSASAIDLGADAVAADDPDACEVVVTAELAPENEKPPTEVDGRKRTPESGVRYGMMIYGDGADVHTSPSISVPRVNSTVA